jgi:hypothetical protein
MTDAQLAELILAVQQTSTDQIDVITTFITILIGLIVGGLVAKGVCDSWVS